MFRKFIGVLSNLSAQLCSYLLLVVMAMITIDLIGRAISRPIYGVSELAMFSMIAIVYLGLPYAEKEMAHVRVEVLLDRLSPRGRLWLELVIYLLVSATIAVTLYAVSMNALSSYNTRQAIAGPSPVLIWPVKFVMTAALGLYLLQIVLNLVSFAERLWAGHGRS